MKVLIKGTQGCIFSVINRKGNNNDAVFTFIFVFSLSSIN